MTQFSSWSAVNLVDRFNMEQIYAFLIIFIFCVVLWLLKYFFLRALDYIISTETHQKWFYENEQIWNESIYNPSVAKHKRELFASISDHLNQVKGDLVELGAGCGENFEFIPKECSLIAIEPNSNAETLFKKKLKHFPHIHLKKFIKTRGESMAELRGQTVSAVVCTNCLCSIRNIQPVLAEIKRVLKPVSKYFTRKLNGQAWLA